jgi:NADPH:quinone reductase-like Zn-dependent oxidoreductase
MASRKIEGYPSHLGWVRLNQFPESSRKSASMPYGRSAGCSAPPTWKGWLRGVTGHNVNAAPTLDKLHLLGELAGSGRLRVPIQEVYPLERATDAIEAFKRGTRGKLIIRP